MKKVVKKTSGGVANKKSKNKAEKQFSDFDLFLFMILTALIGGSVVTFVKISLEAVPIFTAIFFIFLIVYLITSPIAGKSKKIGKKQFNDNFFSSFLIVVNLIVLFFALSYTTVSVAILIYAAAPLIIALYSKIIFNRKLICKQKMGLVIGGMGLFLVILQPIIQQNVGDLANFSTIIKGNILALLSATFFALYILSQQKQKKKSVTSISIIFYSSLMAMAISFLPMVLVDFQNFNFISNVEFKHFGSILYLGVVGTILFYVIFQYFIKDKLTISTFNYLQSIFGVILAIVVFGEILPWLVIVGAVFIIMGAMMVSRIGKKIVAKSKKSSKTVSAKRKSESRKIKVSGTEKLISKSGIFLLLIIAGATAGSITTAAKVAMSSGLAPLALLFLRYLIAFTFMLPIIVKRNELSVKDFKNNFLPSFLAVMNPVVLFYALSYTTASVAILVYAAGPLFMALYYKFFCSTKLTKNQLIGLSVGFSGVALIMFQPITNNGVGSIAGNLMVLVSTLFFVSYTIFAGKQQAKKVASPYSLVFYSSVIAMIISIFPLINNIGSVDLGFKQITAIVWLGLVSTVIFFILFQYIVKKEGVLVASVYAYLQAALGAIIGIVVLKESMTVLIILGVILTFVGAKIVTQKVKEKKTKKKPRKKAKKKVEKKVQEKEIEKVEDKTFEVVAKENKSEDLNEGDVIKVKIVRDDEK
ncbi:MAG: DMT family transporter [Candidatus Moranbacteria bacterium]|nr:DMT family transporter [Candidatus Moranbacteria bacterium]